ncbi:hypothetical protein K9B32_12320 [Rhizobium sp. 3T7]|uniref:hypothetical protein n=1 Tax=Rhizobium sp. 3T7 TaxID=2874922 RepID=UPI001CC988E5|nr:hypothetical protein [Rhizobium sp. 3T7]MBZ9790903.1 hypothetical protein [Rhizobium sp. 3T7]
MQLVALKFFVAVADYSTGRNGSASRLQHLGIKSGGMSVDLMSEAPPASEVLTIGSFFGFRPLGKFRLALLSSLSFMALSSTAAFGTLTIVSERLKWRREAAVSALSQNAETTIRKHCGLKRTGTGCRSSKSIYSSGSDIVVT